MHIALDYDGTYTADPAFWDDVIALAVASGHSVTCITMRRPETEMIDMPCAVVYTSRAAKKTFAENAGLLVDVWVDDRPEWLFEDSA